jgi:hypothetical protein
LESIAAFDHPSLPSASGQSRLGAQAARHKGRHFAHDRFDVARVANSCREMFDGVFVAHRMSHRAKHEVTAPEQIDRLQFRARASDRRHEPPDDLLKQSVEHPFDRRIRLGKGPAHQLHEMMAAGRLVPTQSQRRRDQGLDDAFEKIGLIDPVRLGLIQ